MKKVDCPICVDGSHSIAGRVDCPICDAKGYLWHKNGNDKLLCETCKGSGKLICNGCNGKGTIVVPD